MDQTGDDDSQQTPKVAKQVSFGGVDGLDATSKAQTLLGEIATENLKKMEEEDEEMEEKKRIKQLKQMKEEQSYNQFMGLCDNLVSSYSSLNSSLEEMMAAKDALVLHNIPPSCQANMTLKSSRLMRSYSDLKVPINELTRLVRNYSQPWHLKSEALKKLHAQYDQKKRMLDVALRRLQLTADQIQQFELQKSLSHWEKLYCRVTGKKGHGRRWKFRFMHFRKKADEGFEFLQSYLDSIDREGDREPTPQLQRSSYVKPGALGADGIDDSEEDSEGDSDKEEVDGKSDEEAEEKSEEESADEGSEDEEDGEKRRKSGKKSGSTKSSGRGRSRTPIETEEQETWTHAEQSDRYLCLRVVKVAGSGFAKRDTVFLRATFNNKSFQVHSDKIETILSRERTKSGKSEASQETDDKSAPGSATSSKPESQSGPLQSLDVITWPLEEDEEEKLVDEANEAAENEDDEVEGSTAHRKDEMVFHLTEKADGDLICRCSISMEEIEDLLPPTVDLPDYFGKGEDEGEFLLKDEPTVLTLKTIHGGVAMGELSMHFYFGLKRRPFIASKDCQTDPHLVESVVERILGVDLQKVSLDQLIEGANRMTQQFRHTSTSPIEELQTPALPPELVPAPYPQFLQQPNFGIPPMPDIDYLPPADQGSSQQPLGWDLQPVESVEVTKPIDPIEEEVTPAEEMTSGGQEPIMEEPEPEPDQSTVLESVRESIKTEDDLVSVPEDVKSSPALSSAGNAVAEQEQSGISKEEVEALLQQEEEKYSSIIENYKGEVGDLKMTIEELERALRDVRNQLSRKNSEIQQLQQRKQSMLELQAGASTLVSETNEDKAESLVVSEEDGIQRHDDEAGNEKRSGKLEDSAEAERVDSAHFDRLGESELYRVDGTDGRVDDMTGRTIDTDDLYDQEERKVDLADQEVTFRTDQAIVADSPKPLEAIHEKRETTHHSKTSSKVVAQEEEFDDDHFISQELGMKKKPKKRRIHFPLPDWAENIPKDFLQRQREFSADKSVRVGELRNSVKGQRAMHLEAQMKGQHRLNLVPPSLIGHDPLSQKPPEVIEEVTNAVGVNNQPDPDLTEVCLPALFMPTRTGVIFNARAGKSIAPTGAHLRLTQPPSIFQLPALPPSASQLIGDEYEFVDLLGSIPVGSRPHHKSTAGPDPHLLSFSNYAQVEEIKEHAKFNHELNQRAAEGDTKYLHNSERSPKGKPPLVGKQEPPNNTHRQALASNTMTPWVVS